MSEYDVNGTLFRFPELPPDEPEDSPGVRLATERREKVLAAARKVRPSRRPAAPRVAERVSLATARSAAPAGSVIEVDGQRAEVWSPGPASSSVWALLDDGTAVLAQSSRYHEGGWRVHTTAAPDQRLSVVFGWVDAHPGSPCLNDMPSPDRSGTWHNRYAVKLGQRQAADRVHRLWSAWHLLYPGAGFPFEILPNADRSTERYHAA